MGYLESFPASHLLTPGKKEKDTYTDIRHYTAHLNATPGSIQERGWILNNPAKWQETLPWVQHNITHVTMSRDQKIKMKKMRVYRQTNHKKVR